MSWSTHSYLLLSSLKFSHWLVRAHSKFQYRVIACQIVQTMTPLISEFLQIYTSCRCFWDILNMKISRSYSLPFLSYCILTQITTPSQNSAILIYIFVHGFLPRSYFHLKSYTDILFTLMNLKFIWKWHQCYSQAIATSQWDCELAQVLYEKSS